MRSVRRPGLTLLEVLVALSIFLFSFVAISSLVGRGDEIGREIEWETEATRLAQSKLEEVTAGVVALASVSDAAFDEEPNWSWSLEAAQDGQIPNLWRVTVRVSRPRPDGSVLEVAMSKMILDPSTRGNLAPAALAPEEAPEEGDPAQQPQ